MFLELKGIPQFVDCGKLVSTLPFLHADRTNAEYLLLMGIKGELHILVGEIPCTITPKDIMIILPGTPISGLIPSRQLTYFWCHFNMSEKPQFLSQQEALSRYQVMLQPGDTDDPPLIPQTFHLINSSRAIIFSQQLLNYRCCPEYPGSILHNLLSCLLIELSTQAADSFSSISIGKNHQRLQEILQWIRVNACMKITVSEIADRFNYNPDYLSHLFHEKLGISLKHYIIRVKLEIIKEVLISSDKSIKEIARYVSFDDEKYLMRLFKQNEGITPSEYRNACSRTKFNTNLRVSKRIDTRWVSFLEE